jgi:hypothetical protein
MIQTINRFRHLPQTAIRLCCVSFNFSGNIRDPFRKVLQRLHTKVNDIPSMTRSGHIAGNPVAGF